MSVFWWQARNRGEVAKRKLYFYLLFAAVVCLLVAFLAPGNFVRQSLNPKPDSGVLLLWMKLCLRTGWNWLSNPFLWLFSGVVVWMFSGTDIQIDRIRLWQAFLFPFFILSLLLLPATLGLGEAPPPRVLNLVYAFFVPCWFFFLLRLIQFLRAFQLQAHRVTFVCLAGFFAFLLLMLVSFRTHELHPSNFTGIARSYLHRQPQHYDQAWQERYDRLASATADTLYMKPIPAQSGNPVFFMDITFWPSNSNRFFAHYFGRRMVFADTTWKK